MIKSYMKMPYQKQLIITASRKQIYLHNNLIIKKQGVHQIELPVFLSGSVDIDPSGGGFNLHAF